MLVTIFCHGKEFCCHIKIYELIFIAEGQIIMMWPVATTFKKVYIYHSFTVTIYCVEKPQLHEVSDMDTIILVKHLLRI